ncbi:MAG: hypothetical protein ACOVP4_04480 [Bacteriovoracaceae bacterium]|jgi:hypothetical protein
MDLRKTLLLAHDLFTNEGIDHALIGGLAMVNLGLTRATIDVDLLIDVENKDKAKNILHKNGFNIVHETNDFLQFSGIGLIDILLAQRPISREMLKNANLIPELNIKCLAPEDIIGLKIQAFSNDVSREFQDKADIQFLIENYPALDWVKIKSYSDLFNKWNEIEKIKNKTHI